MTENLICSRAIHSINRFAKEYSRWTDRYIIERDIQSAIFMKIRNTVRGAMCVPNGTKKTWLDLVYSEYRFERGSDASKVDIVVLDSKKKFTPDFDGPLWAVYLPILIGIEIKCAFSINSLSKSISLLKKDLRKLRSANLKYSLVLGFYDEDVVSKLIKEKVKFKKISKITKWDHIYIIAQDGIFQLYS